MPRLYKRVVNKFVTFVALTPDPFSRYTGEGGQRLRALVFNQIVAYNYLEV
jgi:hypothetical protein